MNMSTHRHSVARFAARMSLAKPAASLLLASLLFSAMAQAQDTQPPLVTNHQAEGNLESNNSVGCIAVADAKSIYTPADLYKGVAACITAGDLRNGPELYALAGVYGRFDTLRVTDRSAHQALIVLQMQNLATLPKDKTDDFQTQLGMLAKDQVRLTELCTQIRRVGPPNYVPRYMTQHGMGAFLPDKDKGTETAFDPVTAWEQSLTYLHCPEIRMNK